jgi:hypothetical protein
MTKTLTDKWRAGNLKKSFYYLKFPDTETAEIYNLYDMEKFRYVQDSEKIDVLDEVPSYDEYQSLKKETESLKEQIHSMLFTDDVVQERYDKSVQKMHILEQQLQEANEVIKVFRKENWRYGGEFIGASDSYSCAQSYLDKWGVK